MKLINRILDLLVAVLSVAGIGLVIYFMYHLYKMILLCIGG